ncbi:glycosyltransferase family 2 protein [Proteiniclasticum sp. C24MP]|uniref:glycosyltransferase family 2 protein n=1 Tax=Proteiniclasticum sp. C24MP TaxID=3374101 RepID=UPI00375414D7
MRHFSFVILHYQAVEDTIECIESILNHIRYEEKDLVVVDNGSPDGSGKILAERYEGNEHVHILLQRENMGFARGNNVGFQYAKNVLHTDFIAMINNDTVIEQEDFIEGIFAYYEESPFAILGPDIISLVDQGHQNPASVKGMDRKGAKIALVINRICLWTSYIHADEYAFRAIKFLYAVKDKIRRRGKSKTSRKRNPEEVQENIQLHGSALVFSPVFIERHDGLHPGTFMYLEEDILFHLMKKENLKTVYYPKIRIYHKEDSSTKNSFSSSIDRRRFKYRHHIDSLHVYLKIMESKNVEY